MTAIHSSSVKKRSAPPERDQQILIRFVKVYCHKKHGTGRGELCDDCRDLLAYAKHKRDICPLDPKPKCKDCPVHCYGKEYREKIREVMRFSGMYHVKRGRVDWLVKYFL